MLTTLARPPPSPEEHLAQARRSLADLHRPDPRVYWLDLLATAAVTWGALAAGAAGLGGWPGTALWYALAVLAVFRASVALHELSHHGRAVPGLGLAWNLVWGVPFLLPSYLYERIHPDHHRRQLYAGDGDPEYVAWGRQPALRTLLGSALSLLLPLALVLRFLVLTPLSAFARRFVDARLNSLALNPRYRAKPLVGRERRLALAAELACFTWGWAVVAATATGALPLRAVLFALAVLFGAVLANHLRTLTSHRFASSGAASEVEVLDDSINLEPRSWLVRAALPVGGRLHALHHLAPAVPYHHLAEAHRRLKASLPASSPYHQASSPGLLAALRALLAEAP